MPHNCGSCKVIHKVDNWIAGTKGCIPRLASSGLTGILSTYDEVSMSFAYLPLYTGDYLRDTQHLSCSEHGIYLKFLMHCWDQKGPLPLDERKQSGICNARSGDEVEAMRRVRDEFFVAMNDGWSNGRMQREIERAENVSGARSMAGRLGYEARAKHLLSKSQASVSSPSPSPSPIPSLPPTLNSNTTPKKKREPFVLPDWVPADQWNAWIEARTKVRKPPTDWAKQLAVLKLDEFRKHGHHPARVLAESAFNGWAGLFEIKENAK